MNMPEAKERIDLACCRLVTMLHDTAICACGYEHNIDAVLASVSNIELYLRDFAKDILTTLIEGDIIDGAIDRYIQPGHTTPVHLDEFGRLVVGPVTIDRTLRIVFTRNHKGKEHVFTY